MSTVTPAVALDTQAGAALASAAAELIGPLAPAATPEPLPWVAGGGTARVAVDTTTRYPLVLVCVLDDVDGGALTVVPTATPGGLQPSLRFGPWTERGSALVAYVPPTDEHGAAPPFTVSLAALRDDAAGTSTRLAPAGVRLSVRVELVQGVFGRLLAVLLAEKARLRRQAREIRAMRVLGTAHASALDRMGADVACPRFADELVWDAARRAPSTRPLTPAGSLEDDASYRARLTVLRGLRLPTPTAVATALNGPGAASDPGTGWLADVGLTARVAVDEGPNDLFLGFRLVAPGSAHGRTRLLDAIRRVHLVWPSGSPAGDDAHAARMVPPPVVARTAQLRDALAAWNLPATQPVAPSLARALATLAERCAQLGARPWPAVVAGQSDAGGSRLELGLGGLLAPPDAAALDRAVAAAQALGDPALVPVPRDADHPGAWLLTACGLRTVVPLPDATIVVSAAPMGPLVVDVAPGPDAPVPLELTARLESGLDPAHDAPLAAVVAALAARGLSPAAQPADVLAAMQPALAQVALRDALVDLDLPVVDAVAEFGQRMAAVPPREYAVVDLGPAGTAALVADPATLAEILGMAAAAGASSVVPVVTATATVALVLGVTGLPLAGSNLAARQTILHRWEARGLAGTAVELAPRRGARVQARFPGLGVSLVCCLVHVRGAGNDPYEWRPALPDGALLSLRQYEHLMNVVELVTPVGVRADTWDLRQRHVDVDGSGVAVALSPATARTYRHYRTGR